MTIHNLSFPWNPCKINVEQVLDEVIRTMKKNIL